MHEEGLIQWTDLGWHWREGEKIDLSSLLPRHEARWRERRERILEILKFSKVGMSAKTLGGILNLDPRELEEKLSEWEKEGVLTRKKAKKVASYSVKTPRTDEGPAPSLPDWQWLEKELETLYEKGEFSAGTGWADLPIRGAAAKEIP
jgi:hypothetical protein